MAKQLCIVGAITAVVTTAASFLLYCVNERYWRTATAVFAVDFLTSNSHSTRSFAEYERLSALAAKMILVDAVLESAVEAPRLRTTEWYRAQPNDEVAAKQLSERLQARNFKNTTLIEVTLQLDPPEDAVVILEEVVDSFLRREERRRVLLRAQEAYLPVRLFVGDEDRLLDRLRNANKQIDQWIIDHEPTPMAEESEAISFERLAAERELERLIEELRGLQAKQKRRATALRVLRPLRLTVYDFPRIRLLVAAELR